LIDNNKKLVFILEKWEISHIWKAYTIFKTILMQEHPMIFNLQYGFKLLRYTIVSERKI